MGREGSVGIHQGIKRPLASSFVASVWAPGCLGGEVDREHNRMVWDCRGDCCYPGGGGVGGPTEGLEAPADPSGSALKSLSFSESHLQWLSNVELF